MKTTLDAISAHARAALLRQQIGAQVEPIAANCAWLHGAGYNGLKYLAEALSDEVRSATLEKDLMGLDLHGVSCAYLFPQIESLHAEHGRMFLRNVRHGLFLLKGSVEGSYGIGCPVDPGFALGGERSKNPYAEKLDLAAREGVDVDDALWHSLAA